MWWSVPPAGRSNSFLSPMSKLEFVPDAFHVVLELPDGPRAIFVRPDEHIWDAAAAAGILLPSICHHGRCLSCAGRVIGPGQFEQNDSDQYFPQDYAAGFILLCTAHALSALRIRTHVEDDMRRHRIACHLPAPYS